MAQAAINRLGEMEVFARVVEQGGFSAAARVLRLTPSAVSKLVGRLEARLGTRLVNRSTRAFQLTPEGCAFYERVLRILADVAEAERSANAGERPVGHIRVNTSASYAAHVLIPLLPEFLRRHPSVTVDLTQTDLVVDLLAERSDIAVRAGPLKSSSLIARKLGDTAMIVVGAPSYLERSGRPRTIEDLERHERLGLGYVRAVNGWPMRRDGGTVVVPVVGRVQASDGEALRRLALAGAGLSRIAAFTVRDDIANGRLVPVMEDFNPGDRESFHAIHVGQGGPLPARIRALLDFLAEKGRIDG
ncbi:LysR family transcriptional regulator [Aureimonas endophytica]|uniref:LysR family transcriptional regulator n=1 Tax=Aureimonas endophytica TaxID=2027858 RepID=A0A916ZM10_9HYPH|nr:LysR substrate-binding domain-containing protein [Aureimonas endophytica]GGE03404.1 LysR family transcriptional regulator [Aureimonas endophytica]